MAVELGENFIKIAEVESAQGKREVARLVKRPITSIKEIVDELRVSGRRIRLNMPRHLVTVRFLKLPSTDDNEIGKMVKIESLKHVPYADEDIVSGYRVIEKLADGYSNVLIAVAQAEAVRREVDILNKAGLIVESVSLGSEALLLWYLESRKTEEGVSILLVNIGADHIDIDVVAGDKLVFTRGVVYSAAKPISAEKIVEQVSLSIAAHKKESDGVIDKVILSGISGKADELKAVLADRIRMPVAVIDQMENIPVRQGVSLDTAEASFIELLGLVLRYEGAHINLLPETAREEQRLELVKKNIVTSLVILVLIIAVAFGAVLKKLHDKRAYISYIGSESGKIAPQVRAAKTIAKEISLVTSKIAERPLAIDLASEVFKITPPGIILTMMEYESNKAVTLRGTAPSLSDVFKYVTTLGRSAYFTNIKVKYANKRISQASEMADFEIICMISEKK